MTKGQQLKKFCRLTKFIEQNDSDLYQVIDDLCIMHLFKAGRDDTGITFLHPDAAYKKKIINAAYSTEPEDAVKMLKSLLLHGNYAEPSDFSGDVVNLLNQKVGVESADDKEIKLNGGVVLVKDNSFQSFGNRDNMSVYKVKKGEMPLSGEPAERRERQSKKGGMCGFGGSKHQLHAILDANYKKNDKVNIFAKKVYLQLKMIKEQHGAFSAEIAHYLGNEEVSDSYLLDMYCEKHCSGCFDKLYRCLGSGAGCPEELSEITREKYLALRSEVAAFAAQKERPSKNALLKGISSPIDARQRVKDVYKENKLCTTLGRDLFIVLTNVCKEMWVKDNDVSMFHNYTYLASKIFTTPESVLNQDFDIARDLTLWGNLLKSDVLFHCPGKLSSAEYVELDAIPNPLELKLFSLNKLMDKLNASSVTGGNELLHKYL